ncbi:TonB-dependent receptor [Sphingomonas sp. BK235]|uniref:TonB-dependent receptor n=1 Tax=Sphingomonas sp. BK235 TaxID=2512131 RepID=UPI00104A7B39|nr:TonB-dependent receptor [Sphingomonas sp. BK235]TCP36624.1 TonB-dependent receptor-like protein [Sphingomonas sp. BK235]
MIVLVLCGTDAGSAPQQRVPERAQADHPGDVVVTARAEHRVGLDTAASAGAVSGDDLRRRPLLRTNELAEAVPGLLAVQHSGGGKAAQYYIRGFNLDHGTDFSVAVDGVPMNLPTQAHAQGYLDLNGVIPETIARLDYRKGPYDARDGDFSLVAAADMTTLDRAAPSLSVEAGSFGYRRVAAIASERLGAGELLLAGELKANDGPWALAERLRHAGALAKYTVPTALGTLRLTVSDYNATWRPTEQVPVRAIGTLLPDRFGTLDPFLRGRTSRQIVSAALRSSRTEVVLYAQRYRFDLLSNFTFFLDDPVRGDELEQTERRSTWGVRGRHAVPLRDGVTLTVGAEGRIDRIDDLGFYQTERGRRLATRSLADVRETAIAGYAAVRWQPWSPLTLTGGARVDHVRFHSRARGGSAVDAGTVATLATPKASAALTVLPGVGLYANYGQGFHSNDARGVLATTDPVPALVRGTGHELGVRIERGPVVLTLDRWWLRSDGELVYLGDSGTVEPRGASRRRGWEATLYARAASWLTLDATVATNHARFVDAPGFDRIPNALENAASLGVTATAAPWTAAVRLRRIGPRPLVEDGSVRGAATLVANARVAHSFGRVEASLDLLNVLDSRRADADYFYASRLPGEPLGGIEGVHARAVEPRQARVALRLQL